MALPEITLPAGLPMWLADGYQAVPGAVYGHAQMSVGNSRTRRMMTRAERREQCSLRLTAAQLPVFHEWFENTIKAGELPFAAQVANLGAGTRWWDALASYENSTPQPGGITTITCMLVLRGLPQLAGPAS